MAVMVVLMKPVPKLIGVLPLVYTYWEWRGMPRYERGWTHTDRIRRPGHQEVLYPEVRVSIILATFTRRPVWPR